MYRNRLFAFAFLMVTVAAGGCAQGGETEYGTMSASAKSAHGTCPSGWFDAAVVQIVCEPGQTLDYKIFQGTQCVRCTQATDHCNGPWVPALAEIACAPGYEFDYNNNNTCKRCVAATPACNHDNDCFRTGCSGQICGSEHVVTTCEYRPEYACYADQYCGCQTNGKCGWDNDPALTECIDQASGGGTVILLQ